MAFPSDRDLESSERRFRTLVEVSADLVWVVETPGGTWSEDSPWRVISGADAAEGTGWSWMGLVHPDDRVEAQEAWSRAVSTGSPLETVYRTRMRHGGPWRWAQATAAPVRLQDGRVEEWIGTSADITEARELERRERLAEKKEVAGRLAGACAHELNNALQGVMGHAELLREELSGTAQRQLVEEIGAAAERAAAATRDLVAAGRRRQLDRRTADLRSLLRDAVARTGATQDDRVQLEESEGEFPVDVDAETVREFVARFVEDAVMTLREPTSVRLELVRTEPAGPAAHQTATVRIIGWNAPVPDPEAVVPAFSSAEASYPGRELKLGAAFGLVEQNGGRVDVRFDERRDAHGVDLMFPLVAATHPEA